MCLGENSLKYKSKISKEINSSLTILIKNNTRVWDGTEFEYEIKRCKYQYGIEKLYRKCAKYE